MNKYLHSLTSQRNPLPCLLKLENVQTVAQTCHGGQRRGFEQQEVLVQWRGPSGWRKGLDAEDQVPVLPLSLIHHLDEGERGRVYCLRNTHTVPHLGQELTGKLKISCLLWMWRLDYACLLCIWSKMACQIIFYNNSPVERIFYQMHEFPQSSHLNSNFLHCLYTNCSIIEKTYWLRLNPTQSKPFKILFQRYRMSYCLHQFVVDNTNNL